MHNIYEEKDDYQLTLQKFQTEVTLLYFNFR